MSVAPGWYVDPVEPELQRFWDGEQWVGASLPADARTPVGPILTAPVAARTRQLTPLPAPAPSPSRLTTASTLTGVSGAPVHVAPVGNRFAARLIDAAALTALNILANGWLFYLLLKEVAGSVPASGATSSADLSDHAKRLALIIQVVAIALWFVYEVPAMATTGQTLGKRLTGVRVIGGAADGGLGFRRSFVRWAFMGIPVLLLLPLAFPLLAMDALWCLWDRPAHQCLHDKFAATVVVQTDPAR
jgi:uncharacterized RDD family membrane protein YckC